MELDYYSGFEGEPEIVISLHVEGHADTIRMWAGYFDQIFAAIPRAQEGWRGLTRHYHLHSGWYEGGVWFDPDIPGTLRLIREARQQRTGPDVLGEICDRYLELLDTAIATGGAVSIEYV